MDFFFSLQSCIKSTLISDKTDGHFRMLVWMKIDGRKHLLHFALFDPTKAFKRVLGRL